MEKITTTWRWRHVAVCAAAIVLSLAAPAAAEGALLNMSPANGIGPARLSYTDWLTYSGLGGEPNLISVTRPPAVLAKHPTDILITDPGGLPIQIPGSSPGDCTSLLAAALCSPASIVSPSEQSAPWDSVHFALGEGSDRLKLTVPFEGTDLKALVLGEGGDDHLDTSNGSVEDVSCGGGLDTVLADVTDNVRPDCESVTRD